MEKMWGDARMAVLAEDEAQKWILRVIFIQIVVSINFVISPFRTVQFQKIFITLTIT